ncbi:uncharacterized protein A4U43_C02F4130 [Asparagus officinalis]|uniref:Epidermal patterning factor-like protein n=1 Tax=Asparagus officinalis TaxID=4686 RepID=A0A5P1FKJ7_ASPOF|nr:EPIDERMAL PATTERNING FACTOR-like protein 4 [Asparagus officinalis]ONK77201.1 uncharacterized protein A4U43_C02F4130 [Asparagus officinalis]
MEIRRRGRAGLVSNLNKLALLCFVCVLIFSICALFSTVCHGRACSESRSSSIEYSHNQMSNSRRRLSVGGPGSYPPRCSGKCGACKPCFPVHVPVPPGTPVITEYYPEAWRCKCRNKLYMP